MQHEWSLLEEGKVMALPRTLLSHCSSLSGLNRIVQDGSIYLLGRKMEQGTEAEGRTQDLHQLNLK